MVLFPPSNWGNEYQWSRKLSKIGSGRKIFLSIDSKLKPVAYVSHAHLLQSFELGVENKYFKLQKPQLETIESFKSDG